MLVVLEGFSQHNSILRFGALPNTTSDFCEIRTLNLFVASLALLPTKPGRFYLQQPKLQTKWFTVAFYLTQIIVFYMQYVNH